MDRSKEKGFADESMQCVVASSYSSFLSTRTFQQPGSQQKVR